MSKQMWTGLNGKQRLLGALSASVYVLSAGYLFAAGLWWAYLFNVAALAAYFFVTVRLVRSGKFKVSKDGTIESLNWAIPCLVGGAYIFGSHLFRESLTMLESICFFTNCLGGFFFGLILFRRTDESAD
jgi:hypothetical protein